MQHSDASNAGGSARHGGRSLSCVVPCFNEAANLDRLLARLEDVCRVLDQPWEVVIVDDGSRDTTVQLARAWCMRPGFRLVALSRNFGKEAAMTAGLRAAHGDAVVIIDADLQHPPELIIDMIAKWRSGVDMVYAVRQDRAASGLSRQWGSRLFYGLVNASARYTLPRDAGDFRLMDRRVVDALLALPERTRFMKGLYAWVGFTTTAVPYIPDPRAGGVSSFGMLRLASMALDGMTSFTTWPLRAVSLIGAALAVLAFGYGFYLIVDHEISGNPVSGWTTIVVSLMFFAGIQLISTGILGEYIGRIFDEVKGRPLYIVREEAGKGLAGASHEQR
jgi:glycosyltransferase involved in cell wall biosynthesis